MATPIAYRDETGYVSLPAPNVTISPAMQARLTPLYTQAEIDESMAFFYRSQGLDDHGNPIINAPTLEQSVQQIEADAAARAANSKAQTGVSIAEAAAQALALKKKDVK